MKKTKGDFMILELLIVVFAIGILTANTIIVYSDVQVKAQRTDVIGNRCLREGDADI